MPLVTELDDLPAFPYGDPSLKAARFHEVMRDLAERHWLASMPLGYVVLDRAAAEFFLRSRDLTFPGQKIVEIAGIDAGPLREEIDRNILHVNGSDHRRLRQLVNPSFTPRAADRWRPVMREFLHELYAPIAERGRAEVVQDLAKPYPSLTIAAVMGAPRADAPRLWHWSNLVQRQFAATLFEQREEIEQAVVEFYDWAHALLAQRREQPSDDLISQLIAAEEAGDRLSDVELVNLVLNVLVGGVDTTQSQLAHALRLFAEHPDQWQQLADHPDELTPNAVDEVLRYEPITPFTARIALTDVTYDDVTFPEGTVLLVSSYSGNHDPATYAEPERFDITADRGGAKVLTFGAGPHYCLGSNLARAELEEALKFLAPRLADLRLDGDPEYGTVDGIYGLDALPIRFAALA